MHYNECKFIQTCYDLNQEFSFTSDETRLTMLRLYNTAFYGSNNWSFSSEAFQKFGKTWNVNLRILFNLPFDTHCWIVEDLSEGKHFRQMIFSRFLKYLKSIALNKRPALRCLYSVIKNDMRSPTGSNIRSILRETQVDPRSMDTHALKGWRVYPLQDTWTIPLLRNLMEVRADNLEIVYDDESDEVAEEEDIDFMIAAIYCWLVA